jgi:hypothetical protein
MSYKWAMDERAVPGAETLTDDGWPEPGTPSEVSPEMRRFAIGILVVGFLAAMFLILLLAVFAKPQFFQNLPEPWCLPFPCDRG